VLEQGEERLLTERDIAAWFEKDKSSWGSFIHKNLGEEDFQTVKRMLLDTAKQGPIRWQWRSLLLRAGV
jgi:putative ATPase